MAREEQGWHHYFERFARRPERKLLSKDARGFVRTLREGFAVAAKGVASRNEGNHNVNVAVLERALRGLLLARGLSVDEVAASTSVGGRPKRIDLSFSHRGRPWLVEMKFGLEFNSLAAATLEGLAFKRTDGAAKFLLLAVYSKFDGAADPAQVARSMLRDCGVREAIDQIHVLHRRDLGVGPGARFFVERVNALCAALPDVRRERSARTGETK